MRLHPVKSGTVIALALIAASLAQASGDHDHDRARAALERGEVRPIAEILTSAAAQVPGEVVEVELEREHGQWVYELKVIGSDGRMLEVLMDAATASVIQIEHH